MPIEKYTTVLGETIEYPKPAPEASRFLERVQTAAEDPLVSEDQLIELIYGPENPVLEQGKFEGRGAVTKAVLADPLYRVLLDLLDHKRVSLGKTDETRLQSAFTMTVAEAADELQVTPGGVRKAIDAKHVAAIKKPNGTYLLDPKSVEAYKATRKPRGFSKGPALRLAFGNAPGQSLRVKFADLTLGESKKLKNGKLREAEVDSFRRAAVAISGQEMHRCFIIEPTAKATNRFDLGPFFIEGKFKVVEKVNDAKKASQAFRAFEPA